MTDSSDSISLARMRRAVAALDAAPKVEAAQWFEDLGDTMREAGNMDAPILRQQYARTVVIEPGTRIEDTLGMEDYPADTRNRRARRADHANERRGK